jgi:hypothetical protein
MCFMLVTSVGGRSYARRMEATACLASPGRISSVAVASKLRVTGSQMKDMPLYLRTLFRVLSSWVHQRCDLRKHMHVVYGGRKTCM